MKKILTGLLLTLFAVVFTLGLTFATMELPRMADDFIERSGAFPNLATGQDDATAHKTELYISYYNIRLIGYICFGLILVAIVTGFILEKRGLASVGAIVLFLPVFGHFAATMFFLGGLAFLRFLWLPFLDVSFDIMKMGDVILRPYGWILSLSAMAGINLWKELPFIITGLGLFIFMLGVLAWMYGRWLKKPVSDFWIYRVSRHPQYLGWIIWSYGVLFLPGPNIKQYVGVNNTLPWLLSAMVIVCVAMLEEIRMKKEYGREYESFRNRTPFLFPMPRFVRMIFSLPLRLIFRKDYPERKREIFSVAGFYTAILIIVSSLTSGLISLPGERTAPLKSISRLSSAVRTSQNRGDIRNSASELAGIGSAGVDSLIAMLEDENMFVRWYCANALGSAGSEKAVEPLVKLMDDPRRQVRRAAADALGGIGSARAVQPLIEALLDPERGMGTAAARALGTLREEEALRPLIQALHGNDGNVSRWAAWALGELGKEEAVAPLLECVEGEFQYNYYEIGVALRKLGSIRAVDAFIRGMNDENWWFQAACAEALGQTESEKAVKPLITALQDGGPRLRRAAVMALGKFKGAEIEKALRAAADDPDMEVRVYARSILKKRGL